MMNLLMVNDAVLELHTMEKTIEWEKYGIEKVYTADNASAARLIIKDTPIDILLCDIEMPMENGISLIRWIRAGQYDIDCILLTCHADFTYAKEALTLNCCEYILLPAKYEDIGLNVQKVAKERARRIHDSRLQEFGETWIRSMQDSLPSEESTNPKETVSQCAAYIMKNISDEALNVADIAAHFYLNAIYLNRIFKREKGMNISQWIIRERMLLAAELLKNPSNTAIAVAIRVGYSNYPYFSTVFKKYYGCTPSQYAEKNRLPD